MEDFPHNGIGDFADVTLSHPTENRKLTDTHRQQIVDHLLWRISCGLTLEKAIGELVAGHATFTLSDELTLAIRNGHERRSGKTVSAQTLRNGFNSPYPNFAEDRRRLANFLSFAGIKDTQIANLFHVSQRTVRNWRR